MIIFSHLMSAECMPEPNMSFFQDCACSHKKRKPIRQTVALLLLFGARSLVFQCSAMAEEGLTSAVMVYSKNNGAMVSLLHGLCQTDKHKHRYLAVWCKPVIHHNIERCRELNWFWWRNILVMKSCSPLSKIQLN